MAHADEILAKVFDGEERLTAEEIYRRAVADGASSEVIERLQLFPEGEYSREEAAYTFDDLADPDAGLAAAADADAHARTGAEQQWDAEDLAVAEGHDPTPTNVERARRELAEDGASAIERTVP